MAAVIPIIGEEELLGILVDPDITYVVHLYRNNHTPSSASVFSDFVIATFDGSTSYPLIFDNGVHVDLNDRAYSTADSVVWTRASTGAAQNIYGYYVTHDGELVAAERFSDAPRVLTNEGDAIGVTFTLRLSQFMECTDEDTTEETTEEGSEEGSEGPCDPPVMLDPPYVETSGSQFTILWTANSTGHEGFTLLADGSPVSMTYVFGDGMDFLLWNLDETLTSDMVLTLSYTPGDVCGLDPFIDLPVDNLIID